MELEREIKIRKVMIIKWLFDGVRPKQQDIVLAVNGYSLLLYSRQKRSGHFCGTKSRTISIRDRVD